MIARQNMRPVLPMRDAVNAPRRLGAVIIADDVVQFQVWAPRAERMDLVLVDEKRAVPMLATNGKGPSQRHFRVVQPEIAVGTRYLYRLDGKVDRPDPCSLFQPDGVDGPSAVCAPERFQWTDQAWQGVARKDLVIYELHVGTFTPEGTFEAAIERLDDLRQLGITAIELMPIAQFPGDRNWGYDGVLLYAAHNSYGGPEGLLRLIDAAHAKGLAVILDVVYNHVGPEHAYLGEFGPYFTDKYKTPWGNAINYDDRGSDGVRAYVLHNARMWLETFHFDGLRLDAVHAIVDHSANHILRQIADVAEEVSARHNRSITIIAESDLNDPRIITKADRGGYGIGAQWSDDLHHGLHAFLTGERRGYYADYGDPTQLAEVLKSPFLAPGEYSPQRDRHFGAAPVGLSGDHFVVCTQNHDQVGNRAIGDRLTQTLQTDPLGPAKLRLAASYLLLSPYLPMLFMGEEYGETKPFPFFCSFGSDELIEAVRAGRRREFADFVEDPDVIPDPDARSTFESAKLSWSWPAGSEQAKRRQLHRDLLTARRWWPALSDLLNQAVSYRSDGLLVALRGERRTEGSIAICFNLSDREVAMTLRPELQQALFSSESQRYGGNRLNFERAEQLLPYECLVLGDSSLQQITQFGE